ALRVGRTGDEFAKPSCLDHHRTTALLTDLIGRDVLLRDNLYGAVRQLFEVLGILAGRIVLVARAGQELAVPPPLDLHHSSASLARNVGRRLYRILRPRDSLGLLEISGEWIVKVADGLHPGFIAFLNLIELCFELRGEIDIDDVRKSLQQEIIDRAA